MLKSRRLKYVTLLLLGLILSWAISPAQAFWTLFGSDDKQGSKTDDTALQICAAPQFYGPINALSHSRTLSAFTPYFAPESTLYAILANQTRRCDVLLTTSERYALLLMRSRRALPQDFKAFAKVPLVLFAHDPKLLADGNGQAVKAQRLQSLALPKGELTPAGFAAAQVVARSDFPTNYLKNRLYRAEQEYQVYAMVSSGNVQSGIVTLPLITRADGTTEGSYWLLPQDWYPELKVYALALQGKAHATAVQWIEQLQTKPEVAASFSKQGFVMLEP